MLAINNTEISALLTALVFEAGLPTTWPTVSPLELISPKARHLKQGYRQTLNIVLMPMAMEHRVLESSNL